MPGKLAVLRSATSDAYLVLCRRWRSSLATSVGVGLGVAGLVAIISVGESSALRTEDRLDTYTGNSIRMSLDNVTALPLLEEEVQRRAAQIAGIEGIGMYEQQNTLARLSRQNGLNVSAPVVIATRDGLQAAGGIKEWGDLPSCVESCDPYSVVLGGDLAKALRIDRASGDTGLTLSRFRVDVTASLVHGPPGLETSVIVTPTAALRLGLVAEDDADVYMVRVTPGTGLRVGEALPLAVRPEALRSAYTEGLSDPSVLRGRLSADSRLLGIALSLLMMLTGIASVANAFAASVGERRAEIAIRRAMGTSRGQVAGMFVAEAVLVGSISGVLGFSIGVSGAFVVVSSLGWTFAAPWWICSFTLVGVPVGIIASLYPAWKAARVDPVVVLQSA